MKGKRVFVFRNRNPHGPKFVIRDLASGEFHEANEVWLADATFRVSPSGRLRSLQMGRRSVHAGIVGRLLERPSRRLRCEVAVWYSPSHEPYFVNEEHRPVHKAPLVHLIDGKVYIPREARWL